MKCNRSRKQRGSAILEFVLVGIPMIFILISLFEVARGMWTYHTLAYSVREATRYAAMHGQGCASPNSCQVNIGQIITVIRASGVGLDPATTTATFTPASGSATSNTLSNLSSSTTVFPPSAANAPGQRVKIALSYPFKTILALFWVGTGQPVRDSQTFNLSASSTEAVQF